MISCESFPDTPLRKRSPLVSAEDPAVPPHDRRPPSSPLLLTTSPSLSAPRVSLSEEVKTDEAQRAAVVMMLVIETMHGWSGWMTRLKRR